MTTEALVLLGDLDPDAVGPGIEHATHYEPTPPADVGMLLDAIPIAIGNAYFVDVGCGMGRAVFIAAQRPFRQVVGIEISPALHAIAEDNLASYTGPRACADVRIVRADAARYRFPRGDLVLYLYNPFDGAMLESVVRRCLARDPAQELIVLYHTPVERGEIERTAAFTIEAEFGFGVVYRRIS